MAADGLRDTRGAGVLRRHLLPARTGSRHAVVPAGARRRRRSVARASERDRPDGRGRRRSPRRDIRRPYGRRPAVGRHASPGDRAARRRRGPRARRLRRRPEVPGRTGAAVPRVVARRRASPRAPHDAAHGGLRAPRPGRRRLLPIRDASRLERAALRAHAHRQRPAAVGQRRAGPFVSRRGRTRGDRARHHPVPRRDDAAAGRWVRERPGLGEHHRRGAQRGRLLSRRCGGPPNAAASRAR